MQLGMIGLGRMGSGLVRRLRRHGHDCVVHDRDPAAIAALAGPGAGDLAATGAATLADLAAALAAPRAVWIMVPAGVTGAVVEDLVPHLAPGDTVIDGGNSHWRDGIARAAVLAARGIHFVDVGTSGGVHGETRGFCLMAGGDPEPVARLEPVFRALAPGVEAAPRTRGRDGPAAPEEHGYLHCGPAGAGHFVKMVHNGIEYGLMAAYAEGLAILRGAGAGAGTGAAGAGAVLPRDPEAYRYTFDVAAVTEVWRRGSVVGSWLLDLAAAALAASPELAGTSTRVADSGEGRWVAAAAVDEGVPAPVLTAALASRFASQGGADFSNRVLAALRHEFGGHVA